VVLGPEAEGYGVALGGLDAIGLEDEIAALAADGNGVVFCVDCAGEESGCEDGGEMHGDWLCREETSSIGSNEEEIGS